MESRADNCARAINNCSRAKNRTPARTCYSLYVVTNCRTKPLLQEPIEDPTGFEWHEVTKVAHNWLEVDAMIKPMQVREESPGHGGQR